MLQTMLCGFGALRSIWFSGLAIGVDMNMGGISLVGLAMAMRGLRGFTAYKMA
jgi:hypothetical protein